jgi:hypothetical protein
MELIPYLGALPMWTLFVIDILKQSKSVEEEKQEAESEAEEFEEFEYD